MITHRVRSTREHDGVVSVVTKGDANNTVERWTIPVDGQLGRVQYRVAHVGYALAFTREPDRQARARRPPRAAARRCSSCAGSGPPAEARHEPPRACSRRRRDRRSASAPARPPGRRFGAFSATTSTSSTMSAKAVFPATRSWTAWDLSDRSSGGTEVTVRRRGVHRHHDDDHVELGDDLVDDALPDVRHEQPAAGGRRDDAA